MKKLRISGKQKHFSRQSSPGEGGWCSKAGAQLPSFTLSCHRDAHTQGPPASQCRALTPTSFSIFARKCLRSAAKSGAFFSLQHRSWVWRRQPRLGGLRIQSRRAPGAPVTEGWSSLHRALPTESPYNARGPLPPPKNSPAPVGRAAS